MAEGKVPNRYWVVLGAILVQLALGAIYAWSAFTPALTAKREDLAVVYGPAVLGLDAAQYQQLKDDLKAPVAQGKAAAKALKDAQKATDQAAITAAQGEQKAAEQAIAEAVSKHVKPEVLDKLLYGFKKVHTQIIFSAGLAFFAIVMVLAGRRLPKIGPRKLAMAGGIVLGLGYMLAGLLAGKSFALNLILIGAVGGSGIGLGYVIPIAVGMRWFPDKKGMITGLAVAGFGFGALGWMKLAGPWGHLIANVGLGMTFVYFGAAFLVMVVVGGIWMVFPPDGWKPEGWTPPEAKTGAPAAAAAAFTSGQMLATPQFYMIFVTFMFSASAGLMTIGLMGLFPKEALVANGVEAAKAAAIANTAMAIFYALANGLGRIIWGTVSDTLGRKTSVVVMMLIQGLIVILFQWFAGSEYLLYLGATLIGFNFGGNFALFPTLTADTFGAKNVGQNYGWVFLSYGVGGILGPILGGKLGDQGNFPLAFTICGILCLVAAAVALCVKPPVAPAAAAAPKPAA